VLALPLFETLSRSGAAAPCLAVPIHQLRENAKHWNSTARRSTSTHPALHVPVAGDSDDRMTVRTMHQTELSHEQQSHDGQVRHLENAVTAMSQEAATDNWSVDEDFGRSPRTIRFSRSAELGSTDQKSTQPLLRDPDEPLTLPPSDALRLAGGAATTRTLASVPGQVSDASNTCEAVIDCD